MVGTLLTVVVPTIPGRERLLCRCLASFMDQAPAEVETIVVDGDGLLGDKVEMAKWAASGEYLTVVDDDDYLADSYMAEVLPHCRAGVDFVGFAIQEFKNGLPDRVSEIRGDLPDFGKGRIHGPTPKGVTRLQIWRQVKFRNHYHGDRSWCYEAAQLIGSHAFVETPLYMYDWWASTSAFIGDGVGRDVGDWSVDWSRVVRLTL